MVLPCGILAAKFSLVFTKKLLNFSAKDLLSVISSLAIVKLFGKESFCKVFLMVFSYFFNYFGSIIFLIAFLIFQINFYTSCMLLHFLNFFASNISHKFLIIFSSLKVQILFCYLWKAFVIGSCAGINGYVSNSSSFTFGSQGLLVSGKFFKICFKVLFS